MEFILSCYRWCLLLVGLFFLCVSCEQPDAGFKEVIFRRVDSLALPLVPGYEELPYQSKVATGDSTLLSVYYLLEKDLFLYDLKSRSLVQKTPIRPFGDQRDDIWEIHVHGPDSIFCLMNAARWPNYWHDSTVLLLNRHGNIVNAYNLDQAPVWTKVNHAIGRDSVYVVAGTSFDYSEFGLSIPLIRYGSPLGDSRASTSKIYPVGYLDIHDRKGSFTQDSFCLVSTPGMHYPINFQFAIASHFGRTRIFSTKYHPRLVVEQPGKPRYEVRVPSAIFDSVPPQPKQMLAGSITLADKYGLYFDIQQDPGTGRYWRTVQYPIQNAEEAQNGSNSEVGILVFDSTFQVLGEGLAPVGHGLEAIFTPRGVILSNARKTDVQQDSLHFSIFEYTFETSDIDRYRQRAVAEADPIIAGGLPAYLEEIHHLKGGDYVVLFVPASMGCEGCLDYMLDFFREQHNAVSRRPIYCVVAARDEATILKKLQTNYLSPTTDRLYLDPNGAFMSYVDQGFIQGRVLLFSDGALSGEIVVEPRVLSNIPSVIDAFFEERETNTAQ